MACAERQAPWSLQYAAPSLRADRGVVLDAVTRCGATLELAEPALREDREVVLAALATAGRALEFAHKSFRLPEPTPF